MAGSNAVFQNRRLDDRLWQLSRDIRPRFISHQAIDI